MKEPSKDETKRPGSLRELPGGYIVISNPSGENKLRSTPYRNVFPEEFIPEDPCITIWANVITGSFEEFERGILKEHSAELLCETYKKNRNAKRN